MLRQQLLCAWTLLRRPDVLRRCQPAAALGKGNAAQPARSFAEMDAPRSMTRITAASATTRAPPARSALASAAAVLRGRARDAAAPSLMAVSSTLECGDCPTGECLTCDATGTCVTTCARGRSATRGVAARRRRARRSSAARSPTAAVARLRAARVPAGKRAVTTAVSSTEIPTPVVSGTTMPVPAITGTIVAPAALDGRAPRSTSACEPSPSPPPSNASKATRIAR